MKPEHTTFLAEVYCKDTETGPRSIPLRHDEITIGRKGICDLILPNPNVSRQHAKIVRIEGEYILFDVGSTHGTFVNGNRVEFHVLRAGDNIELGRDRVAIEFRQKDDATAAQPFQSGLGNRRVLKLVDVVLKNVRVRQELERELVLAEETQRALLPPLLPEVFGYRLCAYSKPTRYVGGDFYDFFLNDKASICAVLGDISGKGVSAALLSSMVVGCMQSQLRSDVRLEDAVSALNTILYNKIVNRFVTLFLFQLGPDGGGHFVSAGHNPVYVYRRSSADLTEIASNSLIVGAFDSAVFRSDEISLDSGDMMLIYSDGLTEAENVSGEMLGEQRVRDVLMHKSASGAEQVTAALLNLIDSFTDGEHQNDDITFLVIERT